MNLIDAVLARGRTALTDFAALWPVTPPSTLTGWVELWARLPSGLVHAGRIGILPEPPTGPPLAPGSSWYATDFVLYAVAPDPEPLLSDLVLFGQLAGRLLGRQNLTGPLAAEDWDPQYGAELALALGVPPGSLAALDFEAPGFRADLAAMTESTFEPEIELHSALSPGAQEAFGAQIGRGLVTEEAWLVVADQPWVVDLFSPYVRDLGPHLTRWATENEAELSWPELLGLLQAHPGDPDLAALVARDVARVAPETLRERRAVEAAQGLALNEAYGLVYGRAQLAQLAAPDPVALPPPAVGIVLILAGGSQRARLAAARAALDSGRIRGVLVLARAQAAQAAVPAGLLFDDDAHSLTPEPLLAAAVSADLPVVAAGWTPAGAALGALIRALRRAEATGRLASDAVSVVVSPEGGTAAAAREALMAARAGLSSITSPRNRTEPKGQGTPPVPRVSRRFRA